MRILAASIVIAPLLLLGVLAAAGQSVGSDAADPSAAGAAFPRDKEADAKNTEDKAQNLYQQLRDIGEKVGVAARRVADEAATDITNLLTPSEPAARELETIGAEAWKKTKAALAKASHELEDAWDRIRAQDK